MFKKNYLILSKCYRIINIYSKISLNHAEKNLIIIIMLLLYKNIDIILPSYLYSILTFFTDDKFVCLYPTRKLIIP